MFSLQEPSQELWMYLHFFAFGCTSKNVLIKFLSVFHQEEPVQESRKVRIISTPGTFRKDQVEFHQKELLIYSTGLGELSLQEPYRNPVIFRFISVRTFLEIQMLQENSDCRTPFRNPGNLAIICRSLQRQEEFGGNFYSKKLFRNQRTIRLVSYEERFQKLKGLKM